MSRPFTVCATTRRRFCSGMLAAVVAGGRIRSAHAQAATSSGISVAEAGELTILTSAGGNCIALPGPDGALLIDGGHAADAGALWQAVIDTTDTDRIATLINTHWHPEQTGLNVLAGERGTLLVAHEKTAMYLRNRVSSPLIAGVREPLPDAGIPARLVRLEDSIDFADTAVELGYLPAAHTDGDLYAYLPAHDTLAVGGVLAGNAWSRLDYRNGAWFGGRVRALQWLAEVSSEQTRVVPSHGPLLSGQDIRRQRDISLALFETLIEYMNRGFGPEDAVAAGPLNAYADEFGNPDVFLDEAYRSMLIAYVPD